MEKPLLNVQSFFLVKRQVWKENNIITKKCIQKYLISTKYANSDVIIKPFESRDNRVRSDKLTAEETELVGPRLRECVCMRVSLVSYGFHEMFDKRACLAMFNSCW